MSDKSKAIEKVKKLLALAGSANQHEAGLAAAKAQELMTAHQLTAKDVSDDPTEIVPGAIFVTPQKPELWLEVFVSRVGALNGCASFLSEMDIGWGVGVVGRPDDIEATRVICRYLAPKVVEATREYTGLDKRRGRNAAHSFAIGVVEGLVEQLEQARGTAARAFAGDQTALLVVDKRADRAKAYLEQSGAGDSDSETLRADPVARVLGLIKSREIELQKGLES